MARGNPFQTPTPGSCRCSCGWPKQHKAIPLYEDGDMTRDFVLIDDVASALLAALEAEQGGFVLDVLSAGVASSIAQMADVIAQRYGAPCPIRHWAVS